MIRPHLPTRTLRARPDLEQLKRQAKALLNAHYHGADPGTFALHDAQLVLARAPSAT